MKFISLALLTLLIPAVSYAQDFDGNDDVALFIDEMVTEHQFDRSSLKTLFSGVKRQQKIIDAITRPAEGKDWYQYRPIFMTESRINEGVKYMKKHADILQRAYEKFGVPPQIITAIIGVETFYGRHRGTYRVIDALSTLGFDYPARAKFFRSQLKEFLIMSREEKRDPLSFKGSYAGAMGQPQFIPSSFRAYAIDFDQDGKRDLWDNHADIIGSVANYFARHKWQKDEPVAARASVKGTKYQTMVAAGFKPSFNVSELEGFGVSTKKYIEADQNVALLEFKLKDGYQHWVSFDNFYVITRYNHSPLYAMAAFQLSEAIRSVHAK
jgi:membrane-bound lytic murein transglycosylase B